MCYLKNLKADESVDIEELMKKTDDTQIDQVEAEENVLIPCAHKHFEPIWSNDQQMLINLFEIIEKNNSMIRFMSQSLNMDSQYFMKDSIQTEKQLKNDEISIRQSSRKEQSELAVSESYGLCSRLFGSKKYKYSLEISQSFPQIIYKQRNFQLNLKLVDGQGKIVRNCNILNLCCAVATSEAEWVHENRVGQPFLKGKTQVQLYKGEASFLKIYARDVSRVYPEGKINIVVYSKPSTLLYSGSNSYQLTINSEDIKPLVIQDIIIKAKKKE